MWAASVPWNVLEFNVAEIYHPRRRSGKLKKERIWNDVPNVMVEY